MVLKEILHFTFDDEKMANIQQTNKIAWNAMEWRDRIKASSTTKKKNNETHLV